MIDHSPTASPSVQVAAMLSDTIGAIGNVLTDGMADAKAEHLIEPMGENGIAYSFMVQIPLPGKADHSPMPTLNHMRDAFESVTAVIEQNCTKHFVRVAPQFETQRDFETEKRWAQGYMRGQLIGPDIGAGPAERHQV